MPMSIKSNNNVVVLCMEQWLRFLSCLNQPIQVEEARTRVSETSTRMYNSVLDAHEKSKDLDKAAKDLTKEIQALSKEKEAAEGRRTEAIKKHTELELDVKDIEEKMSGTFRAKVYIDYLRHVFVSVFRILLPFHFIIRFW